MKLAFSSTVVVAVKDLEHAIAQVKDTELLDATGIALRIHSQLWLALMSNLTDMGTELAAQGDAAAKRAKGIDIFALPDGHSAAECRPPYTACHAPRLLFGKSSTTPLFHELDANTVASIRQQDLHRVIDSARSRCVICATVGHHFELPSGAHASQFLRLAEAFLDMEAVDRIAYWVALDIHSTQEPFQDDKPIALVVDHPSMLILGARVQRLVARPMSVFCFPTYPSDMETRTAAFRLLDQVKAAHSDIFVLIGVASTGRLAKTISGWAAEKSITALSTSILYGLHAMNGHKVLCDLKLPDYVHQASGESCDLCDKGGIAITIQASSYMIGYGPSASVALPPKFFDSQKSFFEKWGGVDGALRVHFDDPNEATARHHAFYVNVDSLLDQSDFVAEMVCHIKKMSANIDVILVPDHPTANRFGQILQAGLSVPVVVLDNQLLNGKRQDQVLKVAKTLLVADDMFITGLRFDSINRFLRERGSTHAPATKAVHFFTPLATTASDHEYEARIQGLTRNHGWASKISHLYKFPLPSWHSSDDCPWCIEKKTLSLIAKVAGGLDGALSERLAALGSSSSGLSTEPYFLVDQDMHLPGLGAQSALMREGVSQLQVLFTCASAFQQLRHDKTKPLNSGHFPTPTFVAKRVFSENYTERVIWLGLLRTMKSVELEQDLKKYLRVAALDKADHQRHFIHAELAVAWLTGKLGPIDATEAMEDFFSAIDVPWKALLSNGFVDKSPSVEQPKDDDSSEHVAPIALRLQNSNYLHWSAWCRIGRRVLETLNSAYHRVVGRTQ